MSGTYWWSCYGPFNPWRECPTRPDPGEVLLFYLEKRGIGQNGQVSYFPELTAEDLTPIIIKGVTVNFCDNACGNASAVGNLVKPTRASFQSEGYCN